MRRNPSWRWFALFNDGGGDDGGPPGGGGGRSGAEASLTAFKAKWNNDLERAVAALFDDNYNLREKNRKLREQLDAAKLPEGAVVLTKEQASDWEAYQKLGAPDALVKKEDLDAANAKIAALDARERHDTAAKELGWKGSVLHDLAESKGLHIEVRDETENGKAVKRVYTRPKADEKAPLVLLEKHVSEHLADYLPALKEKPAGPAIPPMGPAGGSNGSSSVADEYLKRREEMSKARTNPLVAKPAATSAAAS